MNNNQSGFSIAVIALLIVVIGLVVAVGWLVVDRQKNQAGELSSSREIDGTESTEDKIQEPLYEITDDGLKYVHISGWRKDMVGDFHNLKSPDYAETEGHVHVTNGALISFGYSGGTSTYKTLEQQVADINDFGDYTRNAGMVVVNGVQAYRADHSHTSSGGVYGFKATDGRTVEIAMHVKNSELGYEAYKASPHYDAFLSFLDSIVELNFK